MIQADQRARHRMGLLQVIRCRRGRHRWVKAARPVERWGKVSTYMECSACPANGWHITATIKTTPRSA